MRVTGMAGGMALNEGRLAEMVRHTHATLPSPHTINFSSR